MATTIDRINQLTNERLELFHQASNGRRGDLAVTARIRAIDEELGRLWDQRRREKAGYLEGIDLVVDQAYRQAYGANYEETVRPTPVTEAGDERVLAAA